MGDFGLPSKYNLFNTQQTKNPIIVVKIAGVDDVLTSRALNTKLLYGDPGVNYGGAGLVYGGMRPYSKFTKNGKIATFRDYLDLKSSGGIIQQRLEPEQGKASVSTLNLKFIDYEQFMTQLATPGVLIPELLGAEIEVWLGYQEISFPQDFFRIFRGYVSSIDDEPGAVTLQISDPNIKRRQQLFYIAQTALSANVGIADLTITVAANANFFDQVSIPGVSANYWNSSIHTYIQIDNEWIECIPIKQGAGGYSAYILGLTFTAQPGFSTGVSIQYVGGGTAGSESVAVSGQAITVTIQAGVTTAQQVANAINANPEALALISVAVYPPNASSTQSVQGPTYLAKTTYAALVVGGIQYLAQPGHSTDISIAYAADGTAGSETVSIVGTAITVHIQAGATTAQNVANALLNYYATTTPLISWKILPTCAGTLQQALTATNLVSGSPGTQFSVIARGARGTVAAAHTSGAAVAAGLQVGDSSSPENGMDLALKVMLSGWNGPWITGEPIQSIGLSPDPSPGVTTTNVIQLPASTDAVDDYGLAAGDIAYLQNSGVALNNGIPLIITRFGDLNGDPNRLIFVDPGAGTLTKELTTSATVGFRSQYDVYPVDAGLKLTPRDVDVAQHQSIKGTFLGQIGNDLIFFITSTEDSGKTWLEQQVYLPIGAYSLTKRGRVSCGYHAPPIANQSIVILTADNILDPQQIRPQRALNNRAFYNEIDLTYDYDDTGNPRSSTKIADADSLSLIGISTVLPIDAKGVYSGYSANLLNKRAFFLLNRYKRGALMFTVKVNWEVGSVVEAGDIALVRDDAGILQIANFATGARGLGQQLFEVIDRTFSIKDGNTSLTLVGNVGAAATDRFATISPSSIVGSGSSTTQVIIKDSFGALYPGNESRKWEQYVGMQIVIHSFDWSVSGTCTLNSIDPVNNYALNVSALGFTPQPGYIVDIPAYPTSADPTVDQFYKVMHAFLTPTIAVASGADQYNFAVAAGDISRFQVGLPVRVHNVDYTLDSNANESTGTDDVTVVKVNTGTNTVTVSGPLGFVPDNTCVVDLVGFADKGQPYRWI